MFDWVIFFKNVDVFDTVQTHSGLPYKRPEAVNQRSSDKQPLHLNASDVHPHHEIVWKKYIPLGVGPENIPNSNDHLVNLF